MRTWHHRGGGGSNVSQANSSVGLDSKVSSPMGLNVYRGPFFSEVVKSLKHNIGGSKGKKGMDTPMVIDVEI
jgi:hypothetical protein